MFRDIFDPLTSRIGTAIGSLMAGIGATTGQTETVVSAAMVVIGVITDLGIRKLLKKF